MAKRAKEILDSICLDDNRKVKLDIVSELDYQLLACSLNLGETYKKIVDNEKRLKKKKKYKNYIYIIEQYERYVNL